VLPDLEPQRAGLAHLDPVHAQRRAGRLELDHDFAEVAARALEQVVGLSQQLALERLDLRRERGLQHAHRDAVVAQLELDHAHAAQRARVGIDRMCATKLFLGLREVVGFELRDRLVDRLGIAGRCTARLLSVGRRRWRTQQ